MKAKPAISSLFKPGSLYTLNPLHPNSRFVRRITIAGRPDRLVRFTPTTTTHLDAEEQQFLAAEIAAGYIGPAGREFPQPKKPRPKLHEYERDERDPYTLEFYDPIERDSLRRRRRWR